MPDYTAIAAKALAGIQRAGIAMTLTRPAADGVYDPALGEYVYGGVDTDYPCYGLYQSPTQEGKGDRFNDGTTIQAGDRNILLAASGMTVIPQAGDRIEGYVVVTSQPVAPGGVALLYRILVKK